MEFTGKSQYSVLMSVYNREKPENLKAAMASIADQTVSTDDFVLVCDGLLGRELDEVIGQMEKRFGDALNVIRLAENRGLGNALNIGIGSCRHELVARMDSDDISFPDRCERQLAVFEEKPEISIVSGTVLEFQDDPCRCTGKREVPSRDEEIKKYSRRRNPFNHPAVMFRKTHVENAGGYRESYHLFEDYYLWIRMFQNGDKGYNIREPLLYMRADRNMYLRRGGKEYAGNMLRFHKWIKSSGWSDNFEFLTGAVPHAVICLLPNGIRRMVYGMLHKSRK